MTRSFGAITLHPGYRVPSFRGYAIVGGPRPGLAPPASSSDSSLGSDSSSGDDDYAAELEQDELESGASAAPSSTPSSPPTTPAPTLSGGTTLLPTGVPLPLPAAPPSPLALFTQRALVYGGVPVCLGIVVFGKGLWPRLLAAAVGTGIAATYLTGGFSAIGPPAGSSTSS